MYFSFVLEVVRRFIILAISFWPCISCNHSDILDFNLKLDIIQDVPDIEGDKTFGIQTFTVHLGQKRVSSIHSSFSVLVSLMSLFLIILLFLLPGWPWQVFWACISLLQMAYTVAILVGATSSYVWSKVITVCLVYISLHQIIGHLYIPLNDAASSFYTILGTAYFDLLHCKSST